MTSVFSSLLFDLLALVFIRFASSELDNVVEIFSSSEFPSVSELLMPFSVVPLCLTTDAAAMYALDAPTATATNGTLGKDHVLFLSL